MRFSSIEAALTNIISYEAHSSDVNCTEFREMIATRAPILMDGAMGTELQRLGHDTTVPLWSARMLVEDPAVVEGIHQQYVQAGAKVITTNTFRTTRRVLEKAGLDISHRDLVGTAVEMARSAIEKAGVDRQMLVAGSIAPLEDCYTPDLVPSHGTALSEHAALAADLFEHGVDLFLIETMNTVVEAAAAMEATSEYDLARCVSFVLGTDGCLLDGSDLASAARSMEGMGADAVMVNCSSVKVVSEAIKVLSDSVDLPIGCYANIGRPEPVKGWEFIDYLSPEDYGKAARGWVDNGASLIGGCCGTTPEHIAAVRGLLDHR